MVLTIKSLYEDENVGAVGSVSNNVVNYQQVQDSFETIGQWMKYAEKNNVYMNNPYENKCWLVGFAMLIKRKAITKLSNSERNEELLDTRFSPGNFEDNDLSIRLVKAGYKLLLCKNSFIYHYGGSSFKKVPESYYKLLRDNQDKMAEKYGIDYIPYSRINMALIDMIHEDKMATFSAIEYQCNLGSNLARIKSLYSGAKVYGIENRKQISELAKQVVTLVNDFEIEDESFDYVILDKVLKSGEDTHEILWNVKRWLKRNGKILVSIKNSQCICSCEDGFTLDEIVKMFNRYGMKLCEFSYKPVKLSVNEEKKMRTIREEEKPLFLAEEYIFRAEIVSKGI